jgi:hypothetical protein
MHMAFVTKEFYMPILQLKNSISERRPGLSEIPERNIVSTD